MSKSHSVQLRRAAVPFALAAWILAAAPLPAVNTQSQTDESESDFQKGEMKSTSLSSLGVVAIAPALKKLFETGETVVWDVAVARNGDLYAATGHEGKVFRYDAKESTATLYCRLPEVEATALAFSPKGDLYVGASPGGSIYRVHKNDRPTTFFLTHETYVWDLATGPDGVLYAATGAKGKIFAIQPSGQGKVLYQAKAANVISLYKQGQSPLLASTQNPALALEISGDGIAKVLLDGAPYDEARSVIRGRQNAVYVAMNGEKLSLLDRARALMAQQAARGSTSPPPEAPKPPSPSGEPMARPPLKGMPSQIIKINANGFVQTVWLSEESPIYCLHWDAKDGRVLAGVGEKGALFEVRDNEETNRVLQVEQRNVMILAPHGDSLYLGTADSGVVYSLSRAEGLTGVYLSRSLDSGDPAQWGALRVRAVTPSRTSLTIATRQGNTEKPDDSLWSAWSDEQTPKNGFVKIGGHPSRFLQYRATLKREAADSPSPSLDTVEAFYLTPNLAPVVKEVKVSSVGGRPGAPPAASSKPSGEPGTPSAMRPGGAPPPTPGVPGAKPVERQPNSNPQAVQISWSVEEPNEDTFQADLFFKGEEETEWRKINKLPIQGTTSQKFETATIPDGAYRVRLAVSDLPSNPPDVALRSQMESDLFIVDNTPPQILDLKVANQEGLTCQLTARAHDEATMIAAAKYNIDGGDWRLAFPKDRIFDSTDEEFAIPLAFKDAGEHTVAFVAVDGEGNSTVSKQIVHVKGGEAAPGKAEAPAKRTPAAKKPAKAEAAPAKPTSAPVKEAPATKPAKEAGAATKPAAAAASSKPAASAPKEAAPPSASAPTKPAVPPRRAHRRIHIPNAKPASWTADASS